MHKIIITFKENTLEILTFIVLLGLIIATAQASAADNGNLSKMMVCREVEQGKYEHMEKLLNPNNTLREAQLNSSGVPVYTKNQVIELDQITTKCGIQEVPFLDLTHMVLETMCKVNFYIRNFNSKCPTCKKDVQELCKSYLCIKHEN